ncbi:MAG: alkaline phosphatase [Pseudomonadota bacterium]
MMRWVLPLMLLATPAMAEDARPKNVILMIADGAGYNMLAATRYWTGARLTADGSAWSRAAMATYALRRGQEGAGQDPDIVYDSAKAWDIALLAGPSTCAEGYPGAFAGYEWHRCTYPDSAATMSAMVTGTRTYNGAVNVDGDGVNQLSVAEAAKAAGRRVGSISTVPFTHATVAAGGGAHDTARGNYHEIAAELLNAPTLDFLAGGGHPDYDGNGDPHAADVDAETRFRWLSPDGWQAVKDGSAGWTLVEARDEIAEMAAGGRREGRILVLPPVAATFQVERDFPDDLRSPATPPGAVPLLTTVPPLAELTRAALSQLDGEDGFFLAVEGGAVDWAMHGNSLGRAIEEYLDFDAAVAAVDAWLSDPATPAGWDDTLVIVTADHDHLLMGPDASVPFQSVRDAGRDRLPGHSWFSGSHSNQLVPLYARGPGAEEIIALADEEDRVADADGIVRGRGRYLQQPELGTAILEFMTP